MKKIKILYVNGGIMNRGGIESFMMSYYRKIDKDKFQIDFIVHGFEKGAYDSEINEMGGKIYNIPVKRKNIFGNFIELKKIFKNNEYKIIHSHMDAMSAFVLKIAKDCNIPIRIAHSHNTQHLTTNKIKFLLNEYARKTIKNYATHYFACSEPAGRWLFGNEFVDSMKVNFIKNAIPVDQFIFNKDLRENIRHELNIGNELVIGHIGRFDYQKNHSYLINIFVELLKTEPNAKLILIGDGHLKNTIKKKLEKLDIINNVIFMGNRKDVNQLLNVFDVFILPSHFEGLGIVLIEAQANGLRCLASNTVPREVNITGNINFLSIKDSKILNWVNFIKKSNSNKREIDKSLFIRSGYEITKEAEKLERLYLNFLGDLR